MQHPLQRIILTRYVCRPDDVNTGTQGSPGTADTSSERKAGEMQLKATLTSMSALQPHLAYLAQDHRHDTPLAAPKLTQSQIDAMRIFQNNLNRLGAVVQKSTQKALADYMLAPIEVLHNGEPIATLTALFDTGALQASYIRRCLVADNLTLAALIKPCAVQVTLGDGNDARAIEVSEYINLPLRCNDV